MKELISVALTILLIVCLTSGDALGQKRRRSRARNSTSSNRSESIPRLQLDAEQKALVCQAVALRLHAHKVYTQVGANSAFGQANIAANDAAVRAMKRIPASQLQTVIHLLMQVHGDLRMLVSDEQLGLSVPQEIIDRYELNKHPREDWEGVIAKNAKTLIDLSIMLMKASDISKC